MTFIRVLIAIFLLLAGAILGLYVGIWLFAIPGVENMAEGFKADPVDGGLMVWGFVQFWFLSWIVGGIAALVCWGLAALFVPDTGRQKRNQALLRRQLGWSPSAHQVERDWNEMVRESLTMPDPDEGPEPGRSVFDA